MSRYFLHIFIFRKYLNNETFFVEKFCSEPFLLQESIAYKQSFYALMFHLPIQKNSWLAACSDWSCNLVFSPIPFILFEMKILCTSIIHMYETDKNFTIFHKLFQSCSLINGVSMGVKYRWKPLNRYKKQWTLWMSSYIFHSPWQKLQ